MTVREVICKSALVKSGITDYALNPYVGCAHNCAYCYASFMARFSRHDSPWGQWVDVKVNIADVLATDLRRLQRAATDREPAEVVISSVTDAYQPLERTYRVTRACLEVIAGSFGDLAQHSLDGSSRAESAAPACFSVLTKSDLVVRDIDVLLDIPDVEVGMTITTIDDGVSRLYEPGASPAARRLAGLKRLSDAGIRTWAFLSPTLPYHSDSEEAVRSILGAIRDAGVPRVSVDRFNPYPASVSRFLKAAPVEAAQALRGYTAAPREYLDRLRDTVRESASSLGMKVEMLF